MLTIKDLKVLDAIKEAPMRFASLYNVCLNLLQLRTGDTGV